MQKRGSGWGIVIKLLIGLACLTILIMVIKSGIEIANGTIFAAESTSNTAQNAYKEDDIVLEQSYPEIEGSLFEEVADSSSTTASTTTPTTTSTTTIPSTTSNAKDRTIKERVAFALKEIGYSKSDAFVYMKLVSQESNFRHCCKDANKNNASSCKPTNDETCELNKVLLSYDKVKSSVGIGQLNRFEHPIWFSSDDAACQTSSENDCVIKRKAGCVGKTAYEFDCNVKIGASYYKAQVDYAKRKQPALAFNCCLDSSTSKYFFCKGVSGENRIKTATYTNPYDIGLRRYAGVNCNPLSMQDYVEKFNKRTLDNEAKAAVEKAYQ